MATLFERTIRNRGQEFRIAADFDDAAIMGDRLRISILAAVRSLPDGRWTEETVELSVDPIAGRVEVIVHGRLVATVQLDQPIDDVADFLGNDIDVSRDDGAVEDAIGSSGLDELIHLIPTDPFVGCIVKSAVSTVLGQTIRCWRSHRHASTTKKMIRDIAGCLTEYGGRMALTFMYRAGRCAVLVGLG